MRCEQVSINVTNRKQIQFLVHNVLIYCFGYMQGLADFDNDHASTFEVLFGLL